MAVERFPDNFNLPLSILFFGSILPSVRVDAPRRVKFACLSAAARMLARRSSPAAFIFLISSPAKAFTTPSANFLCNGNYAVSGDKKACATVCEIAKPEFKVCCG